MNNRNPVPSSVFKWEPAAKVGLATIAAAVLILILLIGGSLKNSGEGSQNGLIPNDAADLGLSEGKLGEISEMLEPLLRGGLSPFDGADSISSGEAVSALLSHLRAKNEYPVDAEGASLIPADEVDVLFSSLFGVEPPRGDVGTAALYDSDSGTYRFFGSEYHTEYVIEIVSTRTLDDVIYIHTLVKTPAEPVTPPSDLPSETVSEEVSSDPVSQGSPEAPSEDVSQTVTSQEDVSDTVSDTVTSAEEESSAVSSLPDVSSEADVSSGGTSDTADYNTVRNAIFTLKYTGGTYIITELRDV